MWLRISPNMDFFLDVPLQGVDEQTIDRDIQNFDKVVYDAFAERLKKAFPEGEFKVYVMDFGVARYKPETKKAA